MGKMLDELARRLCKAVNDRGIVLWFDPENAYSDVLAAIAAHPLLVGSYMLIHDGSHLAFRYAAEPYLNEGFDGEAGDVPGLIGYIPLPRTETDSALAEIAAIGVIAEPGANHDLNMRLHVVAKAALKSALTPDHLDDVVRKAEKGAFNFADLDKLGGSAGSSALNLVFETSNPVDVALKLLTEPALDPQIVAKDAIPQLLVVLEDTFGFTPAESTNPTALRSALETFLLSGEYLTHLGEAVPIAFASLPRPSDDGQSKRVLDAVGRWRSDARLSASYVIAADRVQERLYIASHPIVDLNLLERIETFRVIDRWRQKAITDLLLAGPESPLLEMIQSYSGSFWVLATPIEERDVRWQLLETIARLEVAATQIEKGLANHPTAENIAVAYTRPDQPWCELDTMQRRLELDFALFTPEPTLNDGGGGTDDLELLVERARSHYRDVANHLSEAFVRGFSQAKHQIEGMLRQRDVYSEVVEPHAKRGKVAFVIVDSLRYEMARELANTTRPGWHAELTPAVGTIPTLTAVCKAALVAGANESLSLELKGTKLVPKLIGVEILDPPARRKRLEQHLGDQVATVDLRELTPMTEKTRTALAKATFVLVTSDEIDQAGENVDNASQAIASVLDDLRRAISTLSRVGREKKHGETPIEQIVVVADHGHVFAGDLTEGQKIEPPGPGAHRRIWIGHGGTTSEAFHRFRAKDVGLAGDLEFATPWNLSAFRSGGGTSYFHGGLSPQELLIPVLTLKRVAVLAARAESAIVWHVSVPKNKITSRSVRIDVTGAATEMLPVPERVRIAVEVRRGNAVLSRMRNASVGIDIEAQVAEIERDPLDHRQLLPAQLGIMLMGDDISNGPVSLHLIDVDGGIELARTTDVPLAVL